MIVSAIIPAYNHLSLVASCYRCLVETAQAPETQILIQDDASLEFDGPLVFGDVCQRNPINLGFGGNCNAGARRAIGDIFVFINQDTYPITPGWDLKIQRLFDLNGQVGIVGPTLLFPDGRIQSVGGDFDAIGQPYHVALGWENPAVFFDNPRRVNWITGAVFAVRRDVFNGLAGFDPVYGRGYFEDVDLCIRARINGLETWHDPGVQFVHEVGSTGGSPTFAQNAQTFKKRWVDSGIVPKTGRIVKERFWQ